MGLAAATSSFADDFNNPPPPSIIGITTISNAQRQITFTPYPSADEFRMLRSGTLASNSWTEDLTGVFSGSTWVHPQSSSNAFFQLEVTPLSSNALLSATILSKLTYGPTPDLLDRLATIDPDVFISEQLNPETIAENVSLSHTNINYLSSKFGTPTNVLVATGSTGPATAVIADLRAWLALYAVGANRQLHEILTQFVDNHFVTQYAKDVSHLAGLQFHPNILMRFGAEIEWRELSRWRQTLMNPTGTFLNLLTTSAESPAMIIYLDTVSSRGNGANVPNENYSRELLELFTMGVDNGYDQSDITNMAPCWTGWTVEMVQSSQASNVFAPKTTVFIDPNAPNRNAYTNLVGVWAFNFKPNNHATYAKTIFGGKMVPARFGTTYTTKNYGSGVPGLYQLTIPARTGTNGIQDGYDVLSHLAALPFTQEYISVKLCRLFVHEDFATGYDYTDPTLSDEGKLVQQCMASWESSGGQLRPVLATIFNSALFRGNGGNSHKVKTPFEYTVSAIRALRSSTNGSGAMGSFTASTDGYGLVHSVGGGVQSQGSEAPMGRMGGMILFSRTDPDGYPESGAGWVSAGTLAERIRYVQTLLMQSGITNKTDGNFYQSRNITDPVTLLRLRLPVLADQKDASKVADLFLSLIYPGEGKASLDEYRTHAMNYLNTDDSGANSSPFNLLTPSNVANNIYDTRVRGMVAMLMSLQRFNEQ